MLWLNPEYYHFNNIVSSTMKYQLHAQLSFLHNTALHIHTVYVKSFKEENFRGSSLKLNM